MESCLICFELSKGDYEVSATHRSLDLSVQGFLCRYCFNKLVDSFDGKGLSRLTGKVKRILRKN